MSGKIVQGVHHSLLADSSPLIERAPILRRLDSFILEWPVGVPNEIERI